jgi:CRP-like cAMP-binding protein
MPSLEDLCHALPIATFEPGDIVLPEGASTGKLFVLIEGAVEILKGDYQINIVSDPGAVFGEMSALLATPHTATVRALQASKLYVVDGGDAFLRDNKDIAYFIARLLAQRLHGVTTYLVDLKDQFEDHADHLGMVDEILETIVNDQPQDFKPGSDREPDY